MTIPRGAFAPDDREMLAMLANAGAPTTLQQPPGVGAIVSQAVQKQRAKELPTDGMLMLGAAGGPGTVGGPDAVDGLDQIGLANLAPNSIEHEGTDTAAGFGLGAGVGLNDVSAAPGDLLPARVGGPQPALVNEELTEDADYELEEGDLAMQLGLVLTGDARDAEGIQAIYGANFPVARLVNGTVAVTEEDWASWVRTQWATFHAAKTTILWMVDRLRLMRLGVQWINSIGTGPWREPPKPRDAARIVDNFIAPALDYRLEILVEQRPGFKTRPINQDQRTLKRAEAQQIGAEYQYDQQNMREIIREVGYWCGTDGVCFTESYWDADRGPWDQVLVEMGAGSGQYAPQQLPQGDLHTCVHRVEEVGVSADATATQPPNLWIIRKQIPLSQAVALYGPKVLKSTSPVDADVTGATYPASMNRLQMPLPDVDELKRLTQLVDVYTVYGERSSYLPHGFQLKVCGEAVVLEAQPLLYGKVPMVRWTDGSSDPAFFCRPVAYDWIGTQTRINALESKLIENIRLQAGAKLLAKREALSTETLTAGNMTIFEVKGGGPVSDAVKEIAGSSVGVDVMNALQMYVRRFEQLSGWNDSARGSVSADQSGRAILANREMLERIFAPFVNAGANAMSEWVKVQHAIMHWGYDEPRLLAIEGSSRPDLVREVTADDFDGVAQVMVDPETLMPLPRSLRLFLLEDMYAKGLISAQEYRRRLPFGFVNNLDTPDTDHYARAKRACEAIRMTLNPNPPQCPILWMDNAAIHQDVLERELILPDDLDPQIRAVAYERWMTYAVIAQMQGMVQLQGGPAPQAGAPAGFPGPGAPAPGGAPPGGAPPGGGRRMLPPGAQPFQGTSPGIAAATAPMMAGGTAEHSAGRMADVTSRQP